MELRTDVQAVGVRILDELERAVLGKREALELTSSRCFRMGMC